MATVLKDRKKRIQHAHGESLDVIYAFVFTKSSGFILS